MAGTQPPKGSYFVEAGWVLASGAEGSQLLRGGSIQVENDRIVAVSGDRLVGEGPRLSLPDQLLMPGLISGHTHVAARPQPAA